LVRFLPEKERHLLALFAKSSPPAALFAEVRGPASSSSWLLLLSKSLMAKWIGLGRPRSGTWITVDAETSSPVLQHSRLRLDAFTHSQARSTGCYGDTLDRPNIREDSRVTCVPAHRKYDGTMRNMLIKTRKPGKSPGLGYLHPQCPALIFAGPKMLKSGLISFLTSNSEILQQ
jgi:hypothetical protein